MPREAEMRADRSALLPEVTSLEEGGRRLGAALETIDRRGDRAPLLRLVQRIHPVDPHHWLSAQPRGSRVLWRDRSTGAVRAGLGIAQRVDTDDAGDALRAAQVLVGEDSRAAVFVSARFDAERPISREWSGFGRACAHAPAIELATDGATTTLTACVDSASAVAVDRLRDLLASLAPPPEHICDRARAERGSLARLGTDPPARDWLNGVTELLQRVGAGDLEKAVLARPHDVHLDVNADAVATARALAQGDDDVFVYVIERGDSAFVGASPELLYQRRGRRATSEALAGTRARGMTMGEDRRLTEALRDSDKERREHEVVVRHVARVLGERLADGPHIAAREVRKLTTVQHLAARVTGVLHADTTDADVVRALHPTPAVCGLPVDVARAALREIEPFDRGLYGGPIGVVTSDGVTLAVALRCALLRDRSARLFAGAGVVVGSDPVSEWFETSAKLRAFASALEPDA